MRRVLGDIVWMKKAGKVIFMCKEFFKKRYNRLFQMNNWSLALLAYVVVVIARMVCNLPFAWPYSTGDEYLMMAIPTKLAGIDWKNVLDNYYRYYGLGFSILSYPLFKNRVSMIIIYRFLVIIEILVGSLTVFFSFFALTNFFKVSKEKVFFLSILSGFLTSISYTYIYNENVYSAWVWGAFCIILCLNKYRGRKEQYLFSILFLVNYSFALAVHQRAITLIVCYAAIFIIWGILEKKRLGNFLIVVGGGFAIYKLNRIFIDWQFEYLFPDSGNTAENVLNVDVNVKMNFSEIFTVDYFVNAIRALIGQVCTINFYFAGFAFLVIIYGIYIIKNKRKENNNFFLLLLFGTICMAVTFGGQYNGGAGDIIEIFKNQDYNTDSIRLLYYHRYLFPYFAPVFICTTALIDKNVIITTRIIKRYLLLEMAIYLLCIKCVYQYSFGSKNHTSNALRGIIEAYTLGIISAEEIQMIQITIVLLILIIIVFWVLLQKKKNGKFILAILLAMLVLRTSYDVTDGLYIYHKHYLRVNKMIDFINQEPEAAHQLSFYSPIYIIKETSQGLGLITQINLYDYPFTFSMPPEDASEAVLFAYNNYSLQDMENKGYKFIMLDENQVIYYKGIQTEEIISSMYSKWTHR